MNTNSHSSFQYCESVSFVIHWCIGVLGSLWYLRASSGPHITVDLALIEGPNIKHGEMHSMELHVDRLWIACNPGVPWTVEPLDGWARGSTNIVKFAGRCCKLWSAENILGATFEVVETRILTMKRRLTFSINEGSANIEEWGQICCSGISDMKGSGLADVQNGETSR